MSVKDYECVKQDNAKDCGVCCLLTIIKFYHGDMSKEELLYLTNTTSKGVDMYALSMVAEKIGFSATGVKGKIGSLTKEHFPCIAHVIIKNKYKHFIVIFEKNDKKKNFIIGDPMIGVKKISYSYFDEISTGYYLFLKPKKILPRIQAKKSMKIYLFEIIYKNFFAFSSLFIFSFFFLVFQFFMAYQLKLLLDLAVSYQSYYNAIRISLFFVFIFILKILSNIIKNIFIQSLDQILSKELFLDIYKHLLYLPYLYCKNHSIGDILTRIQDISVVKDTIVLYLSDLLSFVIFFFFSFLLLYNMNKTLTIFGIISILLYIFLCILTESIYKKYICLVENKNKDANVLLVETLEGIETIKNLNLEESFLIRFKRKYLSFLSAKKRFLILQQKIMQSKTFLRDIFNTMILLCGTIFIIKEKIEISSFVAFISLESYFYNSTIRVLDTKHELLKANEGFLRLQDLKKIRKELRKGISPKEKLVDIKISKLSFAYSYRKPILKNISFHFKRKERILFIGKSGKGKSTLIRILLGYLEIDRGYIFLNNRDLKDYDITWLRRHMCYISQNEFLFSDTLYNNIVAYRNVSYDAFLKVTNLVYLDELIKNEELGYQVLIEEDGFNFSGGERQRIFLARGLLSKEADFFILDESLGEVDIETERKILANIFNYYKDKTFIVISHRDANADLFTRTITLKGE